MRIVRHLACLIVSVPLAACGCGGSATTEAISKPDYDPSGMASAVLKQYDRNGNGSIDPAELDACPALKGSHARIDTNKDLSIGSDELKARFQSYRDLGTAAMAVNVDVKLNGRPLTDAVVTFVPEQCMLGSIQGASGKTDAGGNVHLNGPGGVPGLPCGLYRITVSKKGADGKESLPAKFNAETTLGREISADPRSGDSAIHLELKS